MKQENTTEVKNNTNNTNNKKTTTLPKVIKQERNKNSTFAYALGGLEEVGKNMYVIEHLDEIWIIDSGIKFASELSVDGIIPSFEHLKKNEKKIKGLIVTHGHEDHIGAIPHLVSSLKIPKIYAGRIACAMISRKLRERKVIRNKIFSVINNKSQIDSKYFKINFFNVNHSIPDCFGIVLNSPNGRIIYTADFKFDLTPVGSRADLHKMAKLGQLGVDLLLSDSTNALTQEFSVSEAVVSKSIHQCVSEASGRVIIATFASNVYRVREIVNAAIASGRKIAIVGYSMDKVISIATKIDYIKVDIDNFVDIREVKKMDSDKILIISTGTQGEPNAALSKISDGRHKDVKIKDNDTVIFASSAIPGNYIDVERVKNSLIKKGAKIIDNKNYPGIHASGHGGKQEQLLMFNLLKPKFFFPVHGEVVMLVTHGKTAVEAGLNRKNVFILSNGNRVELNNKKARVNGSVVAEDIYVDETSLRGQSDTVISDRNRMAKNGAMVVTVGINSNDNKIVINPIIKMKGMSSDSINSDLYKKIASEVKHELEEYYKNNNKITYSMLKDIVRSKTTEIVFEVKRISPIIVPVILNDDVSLLNQKEAK